MGHSMVMSPTLYPECADVVKMIAVEVCIHAEQPPKQCPDRVAEVLGERCTCSLQYEIL